MNFLKKFFQYVTGLRKADINEPPVNIDLRVGIQWLIEETSRLVDAKNIIWVTEKEFTALKEAAHKGQYFLSRTYFEDVSRRAKFPIDIQELVDIARTLDMRRLTTYSEGHNLVAPICHPETHKVQGYLLVLGVEEKKINKAVKRLSQLVLHTSRYVSYCVQYFEATSMSLIDDLTSLYNQKYLAMVIDNEISRSDRNEEKFSVLFIDIDHFKKVNDSMGHWVGSHLLAELGGLLGASVRKSDYAFRYGGDEFVVVLPATDSAGAIVAAERIRKKVEQNMFCVDGEDIKITLSIGIATYPDHAKSRQDIIKMADEAMYNGKNKSRNIVLMAG